MHYATEWQIDASVILTKREMAAVLADLRRKAVRSRSTHMNLVIFRLACCCGLRVSEIAGLRLSDVRVGIDRPHLVIRHTIAKGGRGRKVPLWWDKGTLDDVTAWVAKRRAQGANSGDPLICSLQVRRHGQPLGRHILRKKFRSACLGDPGHSRRCAENGCVCGVGPA
jgi:integrase